VVFLTPEAEAHLTGLIAHYESLDRPAATRNMMAAVKAAKERIIRDPAAGLPAPRPYPKLKKPGRLRAASKTSPDLRDRSVVENDFMISFIVSY